MSNLCPNCNTSLGLSKGHSSSHCIKELKKQLRYEQLAANQLIDERNWAEDWADKLAYAVGGIELIGEHSSGNNPWEEAYELITPYVEVEELKAKYEKYGKFMEEVEAFRKAHDPADTPSLVSDFVKRAERLEKYAKFVEEADALRAKTGELGLSDEQSNEIDNLRKNL